MNISVTGQKIRHLIGGILVAVSIWLPSIATASNADPAKVVTSFHESLLTILGAHSGQSDQMRYDALQEIMDGAFNYEIMIRTVTGRHWRQADQNTQENLRQAFRNVSIATYADQYADLTNGQFETLGSRDGPRGLQLVDTKLITPSREVELTYVLRQGEKTWQIIDVLLDSGKISELARKASEYSRTLKDGGAAALVTVLEDQKSQLIAN